MDQLPIEIVAQILTYDMSNYHSLLFLNKNHYEILNSDNLYHVILNDYYKFYYKNHCNQKNKTKKEIFKEIFNLKNNWKNQSLHYNKENFMATKLTSEMKQLFKNNELTLEIWVNLTSHSVCPCFIDITNDPWNKGWGLYGMGGGQRSFFVGNWENTEDNVTFDSRELEQLSVWTHYAVTCSADQKVCFYVNGKRVSVESSVLALPCDLSNIEEDLFLHVGCTSYSSDSTSFYVDGLFNEARVWNRVRTQEEIVQYKDKRILSEYEAKGLVFYYYPDSNMDTIQFVANKTPCTDYEGKYHLGIQTLGLSMYEEKAPVSEESSTVTTINNENVGLETPVATNTTAPHSLWQMISNAVVYITRKIFKLP
ncbi:hypothetical protein ABK040_005121 [Willaertia magna]